MIFIFIAETEDSFALCTFRSKNFALQAAKLRKKVVKNNGFCRINAFRPEIKTKRGRTWKFKNRDNAKLGGLVKELGCQIVTPN